MREVEQMVSIGFAASFGDHTVLERGAMSDDKRIDPAKLTIEQAAKILSSACRERIEAPTLQAGVNDGAPTNADRSINLVNYTAWQAKEMVRGE